MNPERLLAAAAAPPAGTPFGEYTLIEEIGGGGMGRVFTAAQRGSGRIVALKIAREGTPGAARRFRTEAEAVAALDHPCILPVYEIGEHDGAPFFTMKFAECGSLAERIADFAGKPPAAAELLARIAGAVDHAHRRGILHRDLKPGNILLAAPDQPLVADFGLARWLGRESDLTLDTTVLGTPDYLAPEMLRGARTGSTIAADIFSLGAILYELLTGHPPFPGETVAAVMRSVEECAPRRPRSVHGEVPRDLDAICMKCLERDPAARYSSAGRLAADLEAWLAGKPVQARILSPPVRLARWVHRRPAMAGLIAALALATAALLTNIVASRNHALRLETARADAAEKLAREQRRLLLMSEARTRMQSHGAVDRSAALTALREAWRIQPSAEIRGRAIAALTMWDAAPEPAPAGVAFVESAAEPDPVPGTPDERARAFDPAAGLVATAGDDKLIHLTGIAGGSPERHLRGLDGRCHALAFSPGGRWIASSDEDHAIRIWDVRDGLEILAVEKLPLDPGAKLRWSADSQWLAAGENVTLHLLRPAIADVFATLTPEERTEEVCTTDLSADGRWLATVTEAGTRLWNARTGRPTALFPKDGTEWCGVRFSPDSRLLWIGGWNAGLRAAQLPQTGNALIAAPKVTAEFAGTLCATSDDGAALVALNNQEGGGFQILGAAEPHRESWLHQPHPLSIAFTRDGRIAATSSYNAPGARLWDVASQKVIGEIPTPPPAVLAFSPDDTLLASGAEKQVNLWNVKTRSTTAILPVAGRVWQVSFSADGRFLAVLAGSSVTLFHATAPFDEFAHLQTLPDRAAVSMRFSRDGRRLAVQTSGGGAIIWHLDELREEIDAAGFSDPVQHEDDRLSTVRTERHAGAGNRRP